MRNDSIVSNNNKSALYWVFEAFGQVIRIDQSVTIRTYSQANSEAMRKAKGALSD